MTQALLREIIDYASRANPYPLYEELRKTPVSQDGDGPYVVSTYYEIHSLLHDPRISSDARNLKSTGDDPLGQTEDDGAGTALPPSFLKLDPPDHDRLRRMTNRPFGPPHAPHRVYDMRDELGGLVSGLIDSIATNGNLDRVDLVDQFAYPFPVTVICRLLGVPREDEPKFHVWAETLAASLDPDPDADPAKHPRRPWTPGWNWACTWPG